MARWILVVLLGTAGQLGCGGLLGSDGEGERTARGGGSNLLERCATRPLPGENCDFERPRWFNDPTTGLCTPYPHDCVDSEDNLFASLEECQATCRGSAALGAELDRCTQTSDCMVSAWACCGGCEPVAISDLVGLRADAGDDYHALRGCSELDCGACVEVPPAERSRRYYYAPCVEGQCGLSDLRTSSLTACNTPSDCVLRCGTGCCPSCDPGSVVALRADVDQTAAFCGGAPGECDACACEIPDPVVADCVSGRCVVRGEASCTPGLDQTCNHDLTMSSLAGTCTDAGVCVCAEGHMLVEASGRCD